MPLTNYTEWKKREYVISSLHLDLKNPRLFGETKSEAEAIEKLLETEDIDQLARQISQVGYLPVEDLVIAVENGKKIVIEGNRRLAAYKLLTNPLRAPDPSVQKTFKALQTDLGENLPRKVWTVCAPDRTQANIYVYMKHTPETFSKRWSKIQQAVFIQKLVNAGESLEEIKRICRATDGAISESLATLSIYEISPHLDLAKEIKEDLADPKKFPHATVIDKIITVPTAQKTVGFSISPDKGIEVTGGMERFQHFLSIILEDSLSIDEQTGKKKLDTRTVGDLGKLKGYLGKLEDQLPKKKRQTPKEFKALYAKLSNSPPPPKVTTPPQKQLPPKKKAGRKYGNGLFKKKFTCCFPDQRIPSVIKEIHSIRYSEYKNSTALLVRLLLELSLIGSVKEAGDWPKLMKFVNQANPNEIPKLSRMLKFIIDSNAGSSIQLEKRVISVVNQLLGQKEGIFSLTTLNAWVHAEFFPVTDSDIESLCAKLEPVFEKLLSVKK